MFRSVIDGLEGLDTDVLITLGFGKDPLLYWLLATSDQKRRFEKRSIKEKRGTNVEPRRVRLLDEGCYVGAQERSRTYVQDSRK